MVTMDDVARMRLLSQSLVSPHHEPHEAVRHLTCVQGQDFPGSTMSIALRTRQRALAAVHRAYDEGLIVRSWVMRGTLFVVVAEDLGWMLALTGARVLRQSERRRTELGLDGPTLDRAEHIARAVLEDRPAPRTGLLDQWSQAGISVADGRGYHLLFFLAVRGIVCQGPMAGREQQYVLSDQWIGNPRRLDGHEAIGEWFSRYVRSHGPVPVDDFTWWTKLPKREVMAVLPEHRDLLEVLTVDGVEHWVDPTVTQLYSQNKRSTSATLLLPGFDELVLGYGDRRAVLTREQEARVVPGGNGMFRSTLTRGGRGLGTWRRPPRGAVVAVEPFADALPGPVERSLPRLSAAFPQ